jgi:KamA family protein
MRNDPTSPTANRLRIVGAKTTSEPRRYRVYTRKDIDRIPQLQRLPETERIGMKAVSAVLPFRVNNYVVEELIDWSDLPRDPVFQLTFPQPEMLGTEEFARMYSLVQRNASRDEVASAAREIQLEMNPHPAGQMELNVPRDGGETLAGMQHKYRETVLFFPAPGQTCHAYCTYCFRWAQFVGMDEMKFANRQADALVAYLRRHPEVGSVLFTGGDPLVMKTSVLRRYVEPLLRPELSHIESIRIGTKAPAYWPQRFVDDADADDLMRLFEQVQASGKHLALMAHYSHPRELSTPLARQAVRRIKSTGAVVRCQAPLIRHVNDAADTWADLWRRQVRLGAVPYYLFVERDTGPKEYFKVPLIRAYDIFTRAYRQVSGLARTVRGPSMSATPGKVLINGVTEIHGERVLSLQFLQGRDPDWVGRPFFAAYDPRAAWLDDLRPAFGAREFFFEEGLREMSAARFATPSA